MAKEQLEANDQTAQRFAPSDDANGIEVDENSSYISRVCQRVQEGHDIWALIDFEIDNPDSPDPPKRYQKWKRFESEAELKDYIRRDTGEPLVLPPFSLSPEQSLLIQQDAKKEVSQVTEDFRRFRVRSEVQRKQIDAHVRDLQNNKVQIAKRRIEGEDVVRAILRLACSSCYASSSSFIVLYSLVHEVPSAFDFVYVSSCFGMLQDKELEQARADHAQLELLKNELAAQEAQWKEAYDFLLAENQALKASGSEALLAAQWRQRYESCLSEKEDLEARLAMEVEKADASAEQRRKVDAGKYEMKYRDLKESFRLYRMKAKEIFEAQQRGDIGVSYTKVSFVTALLWRPVTHICSIHHIWIAP